MAAKQSGRTIPSMYPVMAPVADAALDRCTTCGLPFALRHPRPGETASSWACRFCHTRFFAVLESDAPRDLLENVQPAEDVNPRVMVDGQTIATLYKRLGISGRVFEQRRSHRVAFRLGVTVCVEGKEHKGRIEDVSAGGLSVMLDGPVAPDSMLAVRFDSLPYAPVRRGIVRSCVMSAEEKLRVGVEFLD